VLSRRLLLLFLLALLAVGAYLAIELPQRREEQNALLRAARLFDLDPGTIDAVELDRPGASLHFRLQGTHWVMTSPLRDDAEPGVVAPIVSGLASAEVMRDLGPDDTPGRFGLAPPAVTIRLFAGADTAAVLDVGSLTVDQSAAYARRRDGHVLLVPTEFQRSTTLDVDDYRSRRVVVFDLLAVRWFEIDSRVTGHTAWRRGVRETWFTVVAGDTVAGDSIAVPAVLRRLRGMRVRAFAADADTTVAPLVAVTIHKEDGSSQAVRFFATAGNVFLARVGGNPRTVEIADDPTDIAAGSVATLRDRRLLQFDPARALRLTVTTADTSAVLVRAGGAWALPNPAMGTIDRERAADFIRALRGLRYETPPGPGGADPRVKPRFSLVIYGAGDTILEELYCTPAPGGSSLWFAYSRSLGGVCEIQGAALEAIAARLAHLRG
jgi:hypothetical protein